VDKQLELEQKGEYLRLIGDKIVYITESEALAEEVLATTGDRLGEWNRLVQEAERVKERISVIHRMMCEDEQRPSQYQVDYDMLRYQYQGIVERLKEAQLGYIEQFKEQVVARVKESEIRLNAMCDAWDPDDFEDFEKLLAVYEKSYDQAVALGWQPAIKHGDPPPKRLKVTIEEDTSGK